MSSAWLLPEHIADVLPAQARHIEELRRGMIDVARGYGCELVMPPLLEHVESLVPRAGRALDLKTFKLVDQMSGRTLGLRADSTLQVARIDAHLLNRAGVTRLCYCGPVLHALPDGLHATREPLQFGAEIYGHAGLEADVEVQDLVLDCLHHAQLDQLVIDLGDARIVRGLLDGVAHTEAAADAVYAALAHKDLPALSLATSHFPDAAQKAFGLLCRLYGGVEVIDLARRELPAHPLVRAALDDLQSLAQLLAQSHAGLQLGFDLADAGGNGYYSGIRFSVYAPGSPDALVRGGRYDEVGAAFGRNRAAVGFSLDLKALAVIVAAKAPRSAVLAPWSDDANLRLAVRQLREQGEVVVHMLPGHEHEVQEFACDRELVAEDGTWTLRPL